MPERVKPRYYGMPVSPGRVAELAQENGGLPERVGRHQHLPQIAWPRRQALNKKRRAST
jgi:hypothetical protein